MVTLRILLAASALCIFHYAYGEPMGKKEAQAQFNIYSPQYNGTLNYLNSYRIPLRRPIKVIIHSYNGTAITPSYDTMFDRYLELGNVIITVDFVQPDNYVAAYSKFPALANYIARFFKWISIMNLVRVEDMHIIAYSVGCQVAGMVGARVSAMLNRKIGRITAISATRIGFESVLVPPENRLDSSDANFVEVIHTDTEIGLLGPAGHVDYYPNGGTAPQPGCVYKGPSVTLPEIPEHDGWNPPISIDDLCSYEQARQLFLQGVLSDSIRATKCDTWEHYEQGACNGNEVITFGENVNQNARGKFFFATQA